MYQTFILFVMGVPFYFKKVTEDFPSTLTVQPPSCDRLFLDFNCAIHYCAGQLKKCIRENSEACEPEHFEARLIQRVLEYTEHIIQVARPQQCVMVSLDGIPPASKLVQQRKRRYLGMYIKNKMLEELRGANQPSLVSFLENEWDSNAISPGTQFMIRLAASMRDHLTSAYPSLHILISDTLEYGEGEHKIFHYLSQHPAPQSHNVIYGLDADLIMLSLVATHNQPEHSLYLMREPHFYDLVKPAPFIYLDIGALASNISNYLQTHYAMSEDTRLLTYVFLCFFIGNDFIPMLSFLKLKQNGLDTILLAYRQAKEKVDGEPLLMFNKPRIEINHRFLQKFFEVLANQEDDQYSAVHEHYYHAQPYQRRQANMDVYATCEDRIQSYPLTNKAKRAIQPHVRGWRASYYHTLFDPSSDLVANVCQQYLQGLTWCIDTYFHNQPQMGWNYKYAYSPTILDLSNMLATATKSFTSDLRQSIHHQFPITISSTDEQLLWILPPMSKHLIPAQWHPLYTRIELGCKHLFPTAFRIQTYLKMYLRDCHPELPPIYLEDMKKGMSRLQQQQTNQLSIR
jgi:5'-3' exonuclease